MKKYIYKVRNHHNHLEISIFFFFFIYFFARVIVYVYKNFFSIQPVRLVCCDSIYFLHLPVLLSHIYLYTSVSLRLCLCPCVCVNHASERQLKWISRICWIEFKVLLVFRLLNNLDNRISFTMKCICHNILWISSKRVLSRLSFGWSGGVHVV